MQTESAPRWPSPRSSEIENRLRPDKRRELSGPALRTFFNIVAKWGLTNEQCKVLLGSPPDSTFFNWKAGKHGTLSYDQLERISLVLGILKGLRLIFAEDEDAFRWLRQPNTGSPFGGMTPLERMLQGSIDDLYALRRYLDGWRGG